MPVASLLAVAALVEAATGVALMVDPSLVSSLLLGDSLSGTGVIVARVAGISLLALGAGSWTGRQDLGRSSALAGMLVYNVLAAIYLAYVGTRGAQMGILLWPAVVAHAAFGLLLGRVWVSRSSSSPKG